MHLDPWMAALCVVLVGIIGLAVYACVTMRPKDWDQD